PISVLASGAARPAAMRRKASPAHLLSSWSAPTPTWSACRSTKPWRCSPAKGFRPISAGSIRREILAIGRGKLLPPPLGGEGIVNGAAICHRRLTLRFRGKYRLRRCRETSAATPAERPATGDLRRSAGGLSRTTGGLRNR